MMGWIVYSRSGAIRPWAHAAGLLVLLAISLVVLFSICHSSPVPDRGKKPRREAGRQRPRSTRSSHSRQGRGGRPLRPSSVCFLSGRRRHKMAVVLCSCPRSCSSLSAAGGLYLIGFYLLCSLFENLRCSPPNLPPQKKEEESKFLKFMRNPLSTC